MTENCKFCNRPMDRHVFDELGPDGQPTSWSCVVSRHGRFDLERIEYMVIDYNQLLIANAASPISVAHAETAVEDTAVESLAAEQESLIQRHEHELEVFGEKLLAAETEREELRALLAKAKEDIVAARKKAAAAASLAISAQEGLVKARQDVDVEFEMCTQYKEKLAVKTARLNEAYAKVGELTSQINDMKKPVPEPTTPEQEEIHGTQKV